MFAVQFDADIKDRTIVIPAKEAAMLPKKVKVILLADDQIQQYERTSFDAIKIETKGFRFNREDANE